MQMFTKTNLMEAYFTIEPGFYRRYKRKEDDLLGVHIIEVLGINYNTDIEGFEASAQVLFRPLDRAMPVYQAGKATETKSYQTFIGTIEWNGNIIPRYEKITDPELTAKLETLRDEMYR
jgi:hypothetical protein